jgi:hypothetical protein
VYGGHPLDMDMHLERIDLDHHRPFPLEVGYALQHQVPFPSARSSAQGGEGMRTTTTTCPRAVSDVLALGRRGGGISLNMG